MENCLNLLRYSQTKTPKEVMSCLSYQVKMESDAIRMALIEYKGSDKPYLVRKWLNLLSVYDRDIN